MRAEDFSEAFEEAIFAAHAADRLDWIADHPRGKENPSVSDAGKCPRQVAYTLRNEEPSDPPDSASLLNFMVGHAVEEAVAKALVASGKFEIEREKKVEIEADGTKITGRKDFVLVRKNDETLLELKSTSSKALAFMKKKEPQGRSEHRSQVNLYAYADKRPGSVLLYVAKDASKGSENQYAVDVDYDHRRAESDRDHLARLHARVRSGEDIPRPAGYTPAKFPCGWCDFRSKCWQG